MKKESLAQSEVTKALKDVVSSFLFWHISYIMGLWDIRKRYKRSRLGQFWLVLSMAINISAISVVWALLFKVPIKEYIPYIALSQVIWMFISSSIMEGVSVYISSESYIRELSIPKTSYINALFVRNAVVLLHNAVIVVIVFIFFGFGLKWYAFASIFGMLLTVAFLFGTVLFISIIGLRFRDMQSVVTSFLQIALYVTPVFWKVDFMPEKVRKLMVLNPFAVFVSIWRDPILGIQVNPHFWIAGVCYTIAALLLGFIVFTKFRKRIPYWL